MLLYGVHKVSLGVVKGLQRSQNLLEFIYRFGESFPNGGPLRVIIGAARAILL